MIVNCQYQPTTGRRHTAWAAAAGWAVIAALAATGCRSGSNAGAGSPPTTAGDGSVYSPPVLTLPTTTIDPTTAAVLAGYRAEVAAFYAAASAYPANPFDPRLQATMTGAELVTIENRITLARHQGQHGEGTVDLAPVVLSIDGSTAIISDCLFDHSRIVDGVTGQTVSGPDTERTLERVTMQLVGGTWKVAADQRVGAGCVPGA